MMSSVQCVCLNTKKAAGGCVETDSVLLFVHDLVVICLLRERTDHVKGSDDFPLVSGPFPCV